MYIPGIQSLRNILQNKKNLKSMWTMHIQLILLTLSCKRKLLGLFSHDALQMLKVINAYLKQTSKPRLIKELKLFGLKNLLCVHDLSFLQSFILLTSTLYKKMSDWDTPRARSLLQVCLSTVSDFFALGDIFQGHQQLNDQTGHRKWKSV